MGVTIKIPPALLKKLQEPKLISKSDLSGAMEIAITDMVRRTQSTMGLEGPLPPLSRGYMKYKSSVGRAPIPDRTLTGALLKAIHSKVGGSVTRLEGLLYFLNTRHPASPKREGSGGAQMHDVARAMQKLKPFFGLNKEERTKFIDNLRKLVNRWAKGND
jgi:hypothetical protein